MKGLLLKDWYSITSNCRAVLFMVVIFSIAGGVMEGNVFFTLYPCMLSGMIAMTLISYEEKEKWENYAATLPYTRPQIVSAKYIVSLCFGAITVLLNVITQLALMLFSNTFDPIKLVSMLLGFIPFAMVPAAIMLPLIFKYGANKGRIVYYLVIGGFGVFVGIMASNNALEKAFLSSINLSIIIFAVSLLVYIISWLLSIRFYQKREIA